MLMARTQTLVQLTTELVEQLDDTAAAQGISRSELIRDAVAAYLHADIERSQEAEWLASYTNTPNTTQHDEWGDLSNQTASTTRTTARKISTDEERLSERNSW